MTQPDVPQIVSNLEAPKDDLANQILSPKEQPKIETKMTTSAKQPKVKVIKQSAFTASIQEHTTNQDAINAKQKKSLDASSRTYKLYGIQASKKKDHLYEKLVRP